MDYIFVPALSAQAPVNSPWLYLLYACVVIFVLAQCIFYLIKSLKRAKEINMDMDKIKKVITSSITFSILPSIGIFVGIVTLIGALGIPLPSIRLSIIGALQYEAMAAGWAANAVTGVKEGGLGILMGNINGTQFVTICAAMTVGIIWGPLFMLFFYKKMQTKMNNVSKKNSSKWNDIMFGSVFVGMVITFLCVAIANIFYAPAKLSSYYNLIAVIVSALAMWFFDWIIKKYNQTWLENFSLAFSMILGMAIVAILSYNNPEIMSAAKASSEAVAGLMII